MIKSSVAETPVTEISTEAMQALLEHTWPGHVRELEPLQPQVQSQRGAKE